MPADLVAIDSVIESPKKAREQKLTTQVHEAEEAVYTALCHAGVLDNPHISPGAPDERLTPIHRVLCRFWKARMDQKNYLQMRIQKLERTLRNVLASDALSADQRRDVLSTVYQKAAADNRDAKLLTEAERDIIAHYRATDAAGKQMLRTLYARLADTSGGAR